jgi:hypothetical protein
VGQTSHDWKKHGKDEAMIGLPWHTIPEAEYLQSIWSGEEISRIRGSPAWFALRGAILKANPWMHMWSDPLGSINILRVLKSHKYNEHRDAADGHLTLVFRLSGLANVKVWTNRTDPNALSAASDFPNKTYQRLPLGRKRVYVMDAGRVGHYAGCTIGELLAVWHLGLNMEQFQEAQIREAAVSQEQLNAEATSMWEQAGDLIMPTYEEFRVELEALRTQSMCAEPHSQKRESEFDPDEGLVSSDMKNEAKSAVTDRQQPSEVGDAVEEVMPIVPASGVMEVKTQDAVKGMLTIAASGIVEAKTQDPREPPVVDMAEYDRSWSTEFKAECPTEFTLVSQETGCQAVFESMERTDGNGLIHLQFERCQLPEGHRDRVKVKFRGRYPKQAGMTAVHQVSSMKDAFSVVDLQAFTSWIRRREELFEPSFWQGCCRRLWASAAKAPVDQAR